MGLETNVMAVVMTVKRSGPMRKADIQRRVGFSNSMIERAMAVVKKHGFLRTYSGGYRPYYVITPKGEKMAALPDHKWVHLKFSNAKIRLNSN